MYAIRASRACTGKNKIGVFDGFYHGAHDYGIGLADPSSPRDAPVYRPLGAGVLPAVVENQIMLPYRSAAAFDIIRKHKDELAVVMIEAAQSSAGPTSCGCSTRCTRAIPRASCRAAPSPAIR
jgi:glutamate-1-semialdehyde 2,1-aminomutase